MLIRLRAASTVSAIRPPQRRERRRIGTIRARKTEILRSKAIGGAPGFVLKRWYCGESDEGPRMTMPSFDANPNPLKMPTFGEEEESVFATPKTELEKQKPILKSKSSTNLCRQLQLHYEFGEHHKVFKMFKELEDQDYPLDVTLYNWLLNSQQAVEATSKCVEILRKMQTKGIKPNVQTYNTVIKSLTSTKDVETAWSIYMDMREQKDVKPTIQTYNALLTVAVRARDTKIALELWQAIRQKIATNESGIRPNRETFILFVHVCDMVDDPNGALVVLKSAHKNHTTVPRGTLESCLDIFLRHSNMEGMKYVKAAMTAFQEQDTSRGSHLAQNQRSLPEGVLQRMLCSAAHCASYTMAESLYTEITESYSHPLANHQALMSLLLCYARGRLLKRAFMHIHNQDPKFIVHPAVRYEIAKSASDSTVPQIAGFWEFVNELGQKRPPVHYQNALIVIQAYVLKEELDSAYAIYRSLYEQKLAKTPTALNIMLLGSKTVGQGFRLLAEARNDEIEPDAESYEHMINVFLNIDEVNRAVDFLSNIPSHIRPTLRTYKRLVGALAKENNFGHALDVIKAARAHNYRESSLQKIMSEHGGGDADEIELHRPAHSFGQRENATRSSSTLSHSSAYD